MKLIPPLSKACLSFALLVPSLAFASNETDFAFARSLPQKINWQPCFSDENPDLLCAQYPVPLNYQNFYSGRDRARTINIALIKQPANNPGKKPLGSLFLNPGGPGAGGVEFVRYYGRYLFNQDVRDNYDLIGFDPRGIELSAPLTCGVTLENIPEFFQSVSFPFTREEEKEKLGIDKALNQICEKNGNAIMDHMSTADVARDLDRLRQAVGDKLLNYVGYSYGSYLGVTYANIFPQNVGRLVVDGVLDPIQWSTGKGWGGFFKPVTTRLGSDKGSMATLQEFFRICDLAGPSSCSFAGNSAARFDAIAQLVKAKPQPMLLPDGSPLDLTYAILIDITLGHLYGSQNWPALANLLSGAESQLSPADLGEKFFQVRQELGLEDLETSFDNPLVRFSGVLCSDSTNPYDTDFWSLWADEAEKNNGYFARLWTWRSSQCAEWPGSQQSRFTGPFNRRTKNPVLIANTLFDPATPYQGAETVARLLPNSRLVTVAGWGHGTPGLSACADNITFNYLLRGELPAARTLCQQDVIPFAMPDGVDVFAEASETTDIKYQKSQTARSTRQSNPVHEMDPDSKRVRAALLRSQYPFR